MKVREGNDGYSYPYTSTDLVIDKDGKSNTSKFNEIDAQFKDIAKKIDNIGGFDTSKFMYVTEEVDESIACTDMVLSATELTFTGSGNKTITATLTPSNTTDILTYSSTDKSVAIVDNNGIVTAVGNGSCTITATCGSIIKTCTVSVSGITTTVAVTGVTLDKSTASVNIGETVTLTETVQPTNATNKNVTWSSDAENIATVENGVVTGIAEGTASIGVATQDGGFSATCNVTVNTSTTYKNLFDKNSMIETGKNTNSSGKIQGSPSWNLAKVPVKANTTYSIQYIDGILPNVEASSVGKYVFLSSNIDSDIISSEDAKNFTKSSDSKYMTFTTPEGCSCVAFTIKTFTDYSDTLQMEEGNVIHNYYLPYEGGND